MFNLEQRKSVMLMHNIIENNTCTGFILSPEIVLRETLVTHLNCREIQELV